MALLFGYDIGSSSIKAQTNLAAGDVRAIEISYQMQELVIVDAKHDVLRPAIIWCDSRVVEIGKKCLKDVVGHKTSALF